MHHPHTLPPLRRPAHAALLALASLGLAAQAAHAADGSPMACDDGLKKAFAPDAQTTVVAVQSLKKGDKVFVSDSGSPVTLAADLCLVKLKVGPGNPGPADARSTSEGIGIEVWLPTHANWNQRIRNYGGGGYIGGGHLSASHNGATLATALGSKFPAAVIAGMGYASGTTDGGQPWSQNGSFTFLPDGTLNFTLLKDYSYRSLLEQSDKTRALVKLYYGKAQKYTYFDGHSTGGRQGWVMAQRYPEAYDGYLLAAPAISSGRFGLNSFYPQVVMKTDLGYTSADPAFKAANFAQKVASVNQRAVAACDREGLGFLLDPAGCSYDPARDAAALCKGEAGEGVTGANTDDKTCVNLKEARAINKFWYGITTDGSYDPAQTAGARNGQALGARQLWWGFPRGSNWGALISSVTNAESVGMYRQDIRYAPSQATNPQVNFVHTRITERDKWREIDHAALADTFAKAVALQPAIGDLNAESADLSRLRSLGRKVITYTGLAEDAIPPAGSVHHVERVAAGMGGMAEVQKFLRLYLVPGKAHSSQGRGYVVGSATDPTRNATVPLPQLPGAGNQTPTRAQDQFFTALQDWVESNTAPQDITLVSRDGSVSYPVCVYPQKITWNGTGPSKLASSYSCR